MTDLGILSLLSGFWFLVVAIFFLGASIFVHELGHFLAARSRGLRVERFSIGFGPAIVKWRGRDGVEYRISWLPFGGYVALPQLADMGRIEGSEGTLEENYQHRSLPRASYADKMITLVMGSTFNLIFALILASFLWIAGQEVASAALDTRIGSVSRDLSAFGKPETPSPAFKAGLRPGDRILSVDGAPVRDWQEMTYRIVTGVRRDQTGNPQVSFTVEREGEVFEVTLRPELVTREERRLVGIGIMDLIEVGPLSTDHPAYAAGFRPGDQILSFEGQPLYSYRDVVRHALDNPGQPLAFTVQRGQELIQIEHTPTIRQGPQGQPIGIEMSSFLFQRAETIHPNPLLQFSDKMQMFYLTLRALLSPGSDVKVRNMSGPVGIVDNLQMAARLGFKELVWFLVFININLGILNLLPIPVLDGGHMAFATIARIRGKPLPQRFLESTQAAFVILLFSFMIYVTFFDFGRLKDRFLPDSDPPAARETNESPPEAEE